jgi:cell wall-associated NlpC family hydrolase
MYVDKFMKRYYEGKEKLLKAELDSWLGTPYKHWSGVKRKGVDCIHFVVKVLQATGGDQGRHINIQRYPKDWHLHRGDQLLKKGIENQLYVNMINDPTKEKLSMIEPFGSGDIILFKFGRQAAHVGILVGEEVYQTVDATGVIKKPLKGDFFSRITYVYKLYEMEKI